MAFGGFEQRGTQQPMAEINTTPLVDVMLVLLVIFIITAPLLTHSIRLDLPNTQATATTETPGTITISIPASGIVHWNNEPLADQAALTARLRAAAAMQPQPAVHLRADRDTRYQTVADVMAAAQQAGIRALGFITDPNQASSLQGTDAQVTGNPPPVRSTR
jgi:biopolymer transport protein ExbD